MSAGGKGQAEPGGRASTRAMLRRMMRTRIAPVPSKPAATTPAKVIAAFCEEHCVPLSADAVAELSSRLHRGGVFYFADDGALIGSVVVDTLTAVCDAIDEQAGLISEERWPERNQLRMLADRFRRELAEALGGLGLA